MLRRLLCFLGFHAMKEDTEYSCAWGGVDECRHCKRRQVWRNY